MTSALRAMAFALALPDDWFVSRCESGIYTTRAINYERRSTTPDPVDGQMRMGARQRAFDRAEIAFVLQDGRQVARVEPGRARRDERRERPPAHQRVHLRNIVDAEVIGHVHATSP